MRAAEVRHVEQVLSDGEPHEQRHEGTGDEEGQATGDQLAHRDARILRVPVLNVQTFGRPFVLHAVGTGPGRIPAGQGILVPVSARPNPLLSCHTAAV